MKSTLSSPTCPLRPKKGTVEVLGAQSSIAVNFVKDTGGGTYEFVSPNYVSYICGGGGTSGNTAGTSASPNWPSIQNFKVPASGSTTVTVGVIFYKVLAPNDKITHSNGKFVPTIRLNLEDDRGAVAGYAIALNRAFSPTGGTICSGAGSIPSSPPLVSSFNYNLGTPRELNGGRPF